MKEDRILRCGHNDPWGYSSMCAALGLLETHLGTKSTEVAKAASAERFISLHYRLVSNQQSPITNPLSQHGTPIAGPGGVGSGDASGRYGGYVKVRCGVHLCLQFMLTGALVLPFAVAFFGTASSILRGAGTRSQLPLTSLQRIHRPAQHLTLPQYTTHTTSKRTRMDMHLPAHRTCATASPSQHPGSFQRETRARSCPTRTLASRAWGRISLTCGLTGRRAAGLSHKSLDVALTV